MIPKQISGKIIFMSEIAWRRQKWTNQSIDWDTVGRIVQSIMEQIAIQIPIVNKKIDAAYSGYDREIDVIETVKQLTLAGYFVKIENPEKSKVFGKRDGTGFREYVIRVKEYEPPNLDEFLRRPQ